MMQILQNKQIKGMVRSVVGSLLLVVTLLGAGAALGQVGETPEIVYSGDDALALRDKAAELKTAVGIYEYLHNTIEYVPYHGSRSGSVNTFLGRRGSDVDIATTLIAMLRSQGIPARYAVGTIRLSATKLNNWLGVGNVDVAEQVLKDQGIQGVTVAEDKLTVDFEHAWAEAYVPFDQYRGINTVSPAVDCAQSANAARCTWVALDASFKQKKYNGLNLDPYNAITFDYTAYYNAIKNNDTALRDKNPLTILEDKIGTWLRTNYPGKTLEDVEDAGSIIELREGLLPASLPYQVVSAVRRYDTVALHDAATSSTEPKAWGKRVYMRALVGGFVQDAGNALLAELNAKRLTVTAEISPGSNFPSLVTRLGGEEIARPWASNVTVVGRSLMFGEPFTLHLFMDGAPGAGSGDLDRAITTEYAAVVGGYYLIATGGESSSWTQVHRASGQLLAANDQYKIVLNYSQPGCLVDGANCTPYVDANDNGWDASDSPLLEDKAALDALSGGLLYVAATQYYAKLREQIERADRLMKTRTPVIGFLGVVSSVYEAEYIDDTAFSILPGGLLIDMKGLTVAASYRSSQSPLTYSNRQLEFLGHVSSSLEHETWQELTGYDAISTVRGFQMALASGAALLGVKRDATTSTLPAFYSAMGFGAAVPSPFTIGTRDIFGTRPTSWSHPTSTWTDGFDMVKRTPTGITDTRLATQMYQNDDWDAALGCFDYYEDKLNTLRVTSGGSTLLNKPTAACYADVYWPAGTTVDAAISILQAGFNATFRGSVLRPGFSNTARAYSSRERSNAPFFDFFDGLQGFDLSDFAIRNRALAENGYSAASVARIRNDFYFGAGLPITNIQEWDRYISPFVDNADDDNPFVFGVRVLKDNQPPELRDLSKSWVEYTLPSTLVTGSTYHFEVSLLKGYDTPTGRLLGMGFLITNRSFAAGGGYVLPTPVQSGPTTVNTPIQDGK